MLAWAIKTAAAGLLRVKWTPLAPLAIAVPLGDRGIRGGCVCGVANAPLESARSGGLLALAIAVLASCCPCTSEQCSPRRACATGHHGSGVHLAKAAIAFS